MEDISPILYQTKEKLQCSEIYAVVEEEWVAVGALCRRGHLALLEGPYFIQLYISSAQIVPELL